jgi:hypothetical protein
MVVADVVRLAIHLRATGEPGARGLVPQRFGNGANRYDSVVVEVGSLHGDEDPLAVDGRHLLGVAGGPG